MDTSCTQTTSQQYSYVVQLCRFQVRLRVMCTAWNKHDFISACTIIIIFIIIIIVITYYLLFILMRVHIYLWESMIYLYSMWFYLN